MSKSRTLISLDVGEKRIGVAIADTSVRIAIPLTTIQVDGTEIQQIAEIVQKESAHTLVIGYPRNQQGEATAQTDYVKKFAAQLETLDVPIAFEDESLTSVLAEQQLIAEKKPYEKGDIDARAATIILQDYLERYYG